ncbi:MAG: hypothetical protein IJZ89_07830 [Clostridia bacterium]|nr:hypothetical protein [Clostridia bacterium]
MKNLIISLLLTIILFICISGCALQDMMHEHSIAKIPAVKATCTETGLTEGSCCTECNEVLKEQEIIPITEHVFSGWATTVEATCVTEGVRRRICLLCTTEVEQESLGLGDHSMVINGLYEYSCKHCGAKIDLSDNIKKTENKITIGSEYAPTGDFRWPGYGGDLITESDKEINQLVTGYSTMEKDRNGNYVWNKTAVLSHSRTEDSKGNLVLTVNLNPDLKFSDGTPIKAENYLAYLLAFSTPVARNSGHHAYEGYILTGYEAFYSYTGKDSSPAGASKTFSGVRLLSDHSFSLTFDISKGYNAKNYFSDSYLILTPYDLELVLGLDVEVKDDGKGAYLTEGWYTKARNSTANNIVFIKSDHLKSARYDVTKYAFTGPYTISEWNSAEGNCILSLNPEYLGNFEGQKPSIETIVYGYGSMDSQIALLTLGQIDMVSRIKDTEDKDSVLKIAEMSGDELLTVSYNRPGYGMIRFHCDFSPTMFASVRHAIAHIVNIKTFSEEYNDGHGTVIHGPYSTEFSMWKAVKDSIDLFEYEYSVTAAERQLSEDGWIYNSKGEEFVKGQSGIDSVRYKKLTEEEATEANQNFVSVNNTDGIIYRTVKINGEYYLPCVINWFSMKSNAVTDMLIERLLESGDLAEIGMVIRREEGYLENVESIMLSSSKSYTYSMFNYALEYSDAKYDYSWCWTTNPKYFEEYSMNRLIDEYDKEYPYFNSYGYHKNETYDNAYVSSDGKLGLDYLSMAMINAQTESDYNKWWKAYIERWNELLPDIPLYCDTYYDIYSSNIENYNPGTFQSRASALLYARVELDE